MRYGDYFRLYKLFRRRNDSPEDYFNFQRFQAEQLIQFFNRQELQIPDYRLLDMGCGLGGYASAFFNHGAKVIALDLEDKILTNRIPLVHADAIHCPFEADTFDMVVCASLIEHVPEPRPLVEEILRLLRPGGIAYISFPPFYSPLGGHQFSPFHLLGEHVALRIAHKRKLYQNSDWLKKKYSAEPSGYDLAYGAWGLFPRTIRQVENLLRDLSCDIINRSTRWLPFDLSRIPLLGELVTWHVQFLIRKK